MKPIRILHIIDTLNIGGTEKQCVKIVKGTNSDRINSYIVTLNKDGPLYNELIESDFLVEEFRISGAFYHPKSLIQILKLAYFMRKRKIHIVQTYGFYSTIPGVIAAKIARIPIVIAGKRDMNEFLTKPKIKLEKILWRFCDRIVVNANMIKNYLILKEGVQEDKICVVYNGVDFESISSFNGGEICYPSKSNNIGMIANFRKQKDYMTFLKAAAIVLEKKVDVRFLIVGSGSTGRTAEMKKNVKLLGIQDNVIFHGKKTGGELYKILKCLTISVLSSTNEGMPNALLESMVFGIPIISNPSGGIPELVEDGVTGYLFPYKRYNVLAEKIIFLLENKKIAIEMGEKGMAKAKKEFSSSLMFRRFEELYDSLFHKKI